VRRLKIAVTGARSVIGSELVRRLDGLEACRRLILLDLAPPLKTLRKARFYRVDLTEPVASLRIAEALERERPEVVVHLAFLQHPTRNPAYEHELESLGTMRLLHALLRLTRREDLPHLVVRSSTLVYGACADNADFLDEQAPLRGRRDYALVGEKIECERQLERFSEREGFAVTVLRTAPLLSPGAHSILARYLSLPALPTILGFNPMMQTLAVEDAVEAFLRAIERAATLGGRGARAVYNVSASGAVPLHAMIRLSGRRTVPLLRFAASAMVETLFQAGLAIAPSAHLDYIQYPCVADGERARSELGFEPRSSTRDCVARFARSRLKDAA
jgi:UDP-glucose 4-epimerase